MTCFKLFHCANQLHLLLLKLQGVTDMVFRISDITGADLGSKTVVLIFLENDFSSVSSLKSCPCVFQNREKVCLFICLPTSAGYVYISRAQYEISSLEEIKTLPHVELESTSNTSSLNPYNVYHFIYIFCNNFQKHKTGNGTFMQILNEIPLPISTSGEIFQSLAAFTRFFLLFLIFA